MELTQFGWSDFFAKAAQEIGDGKLRPARVSAVDRGAYQVWDTEAEWPAIITGSFRHRARNSADYPVTGDWVLVEEVPREDKLRILHRLPRRTALRRNLAGAVTEQQVLAANIDTVFVAVSLADKFNARRVERYLTAVGESGAAAVLLLTKSDLSPDPEAALQQISAACPGTHFVVISSLFGKGLQQLKPWLKPTQTAAVIGPSGVGKSTLINTLCGEEILDVLPVRENDQKGRHTTTRRQLIMLPGGALIIDTPGLRELQLWEAEQGLQGAFPDIEHLALRCRFSNCTHLTEPGCAVQGALSSGQLDPVRFQSYNKLKEEIAEFERRRTIRLKAEQRRKSRLLNKTFLAQLDRNE